MSAVEDFFSEIDGASVSVGDRNWRVTLYSVTVESARRWLQLNVTSGSDTYPLLLSLPLSARPGRALKALAEWLTGPLAPDDRVISI